MVSGYDVFDFVLYSLWRGDRINQMASLVLATSYNRLKMRWERSNPNFKLLCGAGAIISLEQARRGKKQDDIISPSAEHFQERTQAI